MGASRIRVLAAGYAAVPGTSPHGAAMTSMIQGLRAELDLVTLKTEDLPHIKRIADARMFRVPVAKALEEERRNLYMRAVERQLGAETYHVVHVFDPWAGQVAARHPRRRASAVLVYERTTFPEPDEEEAWLEADRATREASQRVLVSTAQSARALAGGVGVEVVRPGVDVGAFDYGEAGPFDIPRVLYLGMFEGHRGLPVLLEALERIRAVRPVRALLAGDPDSRRREALRAAVRATGLQDVVQVRGQPEAHNLPSLIAAADVCVAPSTGHSVDGWTPLPQPLLEYMACYRPVVAADCGGVTEIVRDDVEGLLYPAGSASALADALLEVLRDAVMRERVAAAAYRRARTEHSAGARRRRIRAIYEALVPGSQRYDPWEEGFHAPTGLLELSDSQIVQLQDEGLETIRPPSERRAERRSPLDLASARAAAASREEADRPLEGRGDTTELLPPVEVRGEPTRPRAELGASPDTHPGLSVPDTDPGRR